jgi:hypothetical protein
MYAFVGGLRCTLIYQNWCESRFAGQSATNIGGPPGFSPPEAD